MFFFGPFFLIALNITETTVVSQIMKKSPPKKYIKSTIIYFAFIRLAKDGLCFFYFDDPKIRRLFAVSVYIRCKGLLNSQRRNFLKEKGSISYNSPYKSGVSATNLKVLRFRPSEDGMGSGICLGS